MPCPLSETNPLVVELDARRPNGRGGSVRKASTPESEEAMKIGRIARKGTGRWLESEHVPLVQMRERVVEPAGLGVQGFPAQRGQKNDEHERPLQPGPDESRHTFTLLHGAPQ